MTVYCNRRPKIPEQANCLMQPSTGSSFCSPEGLPRTRIYSFQDTDSLSTALKDPPRVAPFILKLGACIHIVADGDTLFECPSEQETILDLMACYYVFHFHYAHEVAPALHFLQSEGFNMPDELTAKSLTVFLPEFNKLRATSV